MSGIDIAGLVSDYDAGLLNDWGGGNVDWWQDYLRAEIGRANDFWRSQVESLSAAQAAENASLLKERAEAVTEALEATRQRDEALAALKASEEREAAIAAAIGSVRFMDPPDGGDVSLAEQVGRMRQALQTAETALSRVKEAGKELYKWTLVIESAMHHDAPREHPKVVAAIKQMFSALENSPAGLADAHSKDPSRPAMPKEEDTHG